MSAMPHRYGHSNNGRSLSSHDIITEKARMILVVIVIIVTLFSLAVARILISISNK